LTGPELRAALKSLNLRQTTLAEVLGVSPNTVHRWVKGDMAVPQYATAYVTLLQLSVTRNPGE
jgi:transcriptional regulator with XRE-family HTH domain